MPSKKQGHAAGWAKFYKTRYIVMKKSPEKQECGKIHLNQSFWRFP
jgi:hypothetical protein